ncbi:hypothetical protein BDW60DRAFT_184256 [Aspergillus nidulans var. acristatus]
MNCARVLDQKRQGSRRPTSEHRAQSLLGGDRVRPILLVLCGLFLPHFGQWSRLRPNDPTTIHHYFYSGLSLPLVFPGRPTWAKA